MKLNKRKVMKGTLQEALTAARIELELDNREVDDCVTYRGTPNVETVSIGGERVDIYIPTDMDALCNSCSSDDCDDCGFAREHRESLNSTVTDVVIPKSNIVGKGKYLHTRNLCLNCTDDCNNCDRIR